MTLWCVFPQKSSSNYVFVLFQGNLSVTPDGPECKVWIYILYPAGWVSSQSGTFTFVHSELEFCSLRFPAGTRGNISHTSEFPHHWQHFLFFLNTHFQLRNIFGAVLCSSNVNSDDKYFWVASTQISVVAAAAAAIFVIHSTASSSSFWPLYVLFQCNL